MAGRFKLLRGKHSENGEIYKPGDVFDSKNDLDKMHNLYGVKRVERIDGPTQETQAPVIPDLKVAKTEEKPNLGGFDFEKADRYTVKELKTYCHEQGITLASEQNTKAEIIAAIYAETGFKPEDSSDED